MKIETQTREDHQVQIIAELETEQLEGYKKRAARQIAKQSKIPGFRPGKAPYDVVKRYHGEEAIHQQAIELMVDDIYPKALEEAQVDPSGPGSLEEIISVDPPKFSFLVPLTPTVELPDYQAIRKDYELPPVTDDDVEKVIQNLQRNYATAEPAERPSEKGDLVYLKVSGDLVNPEEGEDPHVVRETPLQVVAGEESPETGNWPYEGFSDEVIGLSADEEKEVEYTFPEDSPYERLQGKTVKFHVTVQSVKSLALPELDDEFAKTMGEFESFDELKDTIRKQLEHNNEHEYDDKYLGELVDEIVSQATIKYPPQVIDHEVEHILEALQQDLAQQQMDLETYLLSRQTDRSRFIEEEARPVARRRLERSLVLDELARVENIRVENDELQNAVVQRMMEMQGQGSVDFSKYKTAAARQELTNNIAMDTAGRLMSQHTLRRLKAIASGQAEAEPLQEPSGEEVVVDETQENQAEPEPLQEPTGEEVVVDETLEGQAEAETIPDTILETSEDTGEPETEADDTAEEQEDEPKTE